MALEPMDVFAEVEADPDTTPCGGASGQRHAFRALARARMFGESLGLHLAPTTLHWIELALATPVVLWGGSPFFQRFWASLVNRSPNMFTLNRSGNGRGVISTA